MTISLFDRVENTVRKGENAGYQHFLLFSRCVTKVGIVSFLKEVYFVCTVKPVREVMKVVSYSRWSLIAGSIRLI